jgi:tetratricopeptide (TPR) repeat protein
LRLFFSEERWLCEAIRKTRKIALVGAILTMSLCALNAAPAPSQAAQTPRAKGAAASSPTDPAGQIEAVRKAFDAGHNVEASRLANTFSAQHKDDADFHTQLGVLLATHEQYKLAQLELEKANALKPDSFDVLFPLAQTYVHNKKDSDAELALNRALKLRPESAETQYLLAGIYVREGKLSDALELLVRAHKTAPENADVIFLLGRVSMIQNYFEDAIPLLESGVKIAPKRADLRASLGESYFQAGRNEKAIEQFKTLIELDPSASSYAFMGISYRHLGRYDEARKYFDAGLKKDPHNASCLFNLGYIEMRQGNNERAEELFQQALRYKPDMSEALLQLADLRIAANKLDEAVTLLRKYVKVSKEPAAGYYRLAMVERNLHQEAAAERDLSVFQTLNKIPIGSYPYQNLFDYIGNRSNLSEHDRDEIDLKQVTEEIAKHPDNPNNFYLLATVNLKLGKVADAKQAIAQLDQISTTDFRMQAGVGVLLARYRLYDDVKFDLADAYFRKGLYQQALDNINEISENGRQDDTYLALLGDIYAHLGDSARATEIFRDAIHRNPDNDQYYLSLALVQLRGKDVDGAAATLRQGQTRIPSSGKISWGLGIVSVLEGKTPQAAERLERAVNLLPEWPGSYSTLGIFYYQTGEIAKARELLARFKGSNAGGLDVNRIEQALAQAPDRPSTLNEPMPENARVQFLQIALSVADRTL